MENYRGLLRLIYKISNEANQNDVTKFNEEYNKLLQKNEGDKFLRFIKANINAQLASGILRFGTMVIQGQQVETFPLAITYIIIDKLNKIANPPPQVVKKSGLFISNLSDMLDFSSLLSLIYEINNTQSYPMVELFNKKYKELIESGKERQFLNYLEHHLDGEKVDGVIHFGGTLIIEGQPVEKFPLKVTFIIIDKVNKANEANAERPKY